MSGSSPRFWLVALPLVVFVIAAFVPVLDNSFVNWDDDKNFLENPSFRGLGRAQVKWACSTFRLGVYQPLAWLLFEAEYVISKLDPRGYHLTSLALHAANSIVLFRMTLTILLWCRPGCSPLAWWSCSLSAALATALFMVHPLRVESVAWASCQPYLPCTLFSMLAVLAYLRALVPGPRPRWTWLVGSFILFVAALLSHAVALSLPAVLVILDVYPLRRFDQGRGRWFTPAARKIWREKVPFAIVSCIFIGLAIAARRQSLNTVEQNSPSASVAQACFGIWFYLFRTALPLNLTAVYPAPAAIDWRAPPFMMVILATVAVSVGLFVVRRRWPGLLAAWLSYLIILAPNSGVIRTNDQIAADRYSYLSMVGLVIVLAGCLCRFCQTEGRMRPIAHGAIAVAVGWLFLLIPLTWNQCRTWRNSETLWTHAVRHGAGESYLAHYNLALVLYRQGKLEAAAAQTAVALAINPHDALALNNLGVILQRQGKLDAAAAQYAAAVRLDANCLDAHYNLGIVRSIQGRFEEAAGHYALALLINPGFAAAHNNLGVDLFRQGKFVEAEAQYALALRLDSNRADTHTNLGVVLSRQGRLDEAAAHYALALMLDPGYSEARQNLEVDRARRTKIE